MKANKIFPLLVWLTSVVLVAPLLTLLAGIFTKSGFFNKPSDINLIFAFMAYGLLFSLPAFLVSLIVYFLLVKKMPAKQTVKLVYASSSILLELATLLVLFGFDVFRDAAGIVGIYAGSIIISCLLYKVYKTNQPTN
ncbi:MAG: hypothetical protein JST87_00335 [Bacteroidetes bacterium]|nr:hypothetical protein [Bacteroidota bacterium]